MDGYALRHADEAFEQYRRMPETARADFLDAIANEITALGDALLQRAHRETGLPIDRLTGERGRTCGQLKLFASLIREGSWVDARIDTAMPDRQPLPRPDLRRMLTPLGRLLGEPGVGPATARLLGVVLAGQPELAARVGVTVANLSILKTGKARAVRFSTLDALCRALNCQPGDLLRWEDGPSDHDGM